MTLRKKLPLLGGGGGDAGPYHRVGMKIVYADFTQTAGVMGVVRNEVLSGWWVRSEVGSGSLYWCNSGDVPQIGAVVFALLFVRLNLRQL
jgi:hypothetical protein